MYATLKKQMRGSGIFTKVCLFKKNHIFFFLNKKGIVTEFFMGLHGSF